MTEQTQTPSTPKTVPGPSCSPTYSPSWAAALDAWDRHLQAAVTAASTRHRRRCYLLAVARTVPDPWAATGDLLADAIAAAGLGPVSAEAARTAVRAFYRWALAAGQVSADPARHLARTAPRTGDQGEAPAGRGERATAPPRVVNRRPAVRRSAAELPPAWQAAVTAWSTYEQASGRSAASIRVRRHYLACVAASQPDPWAVTAGHLLSFLAAPEWAPATRKSARGALRAFYAWAHDAGHLATDPARALPAVHVPAGTPRPAPATVVAAAYERAAGGELLMLDLALLAGLRRSEIARVHTDDLADNQLRVHGKGGKVRTIPLTPDLAERLGRLPRGWAFPGRTGTHLTPGHVGKLLTALLGDGWSAHTLRHAAATRWYAAGRDLAVVQRLLGHARLDTTLVYAQLPTGIERDVVMAAAGL